MSIVANQYNLISEQLRRGIGDLNRGKLQEKALEAETEKTKFEMGMARRGMELREDANRRANELFPSQLEASQTQAKIAKAQLPKAQLEMEKYAADLKKYNTPASEDYTKRKLASNLMPGMVQGPGGERFVNDTLKSAGYTFKDGQAYKDGKRVNEYDIDADTDISIIPHLVDPLEALDGMKTSVQGEIEQAALNGNEEMAKKLGEVWRFADNKIKEVEKDPGTAYAKRFHYALSAVVASKNPEKFYPALKMMNEQAKAKIAAGTKKPANYVFKKFYNSADPNDVQEVIVDKTDIVSWINTQREWNRAGYSVQEPTVGSMAATALIRLGELKEGELLSPKDLTALRLYAQQTGEDVGETITKMLGVDPEFLRITQREREGLPVEISSAEYLRRRKQDMADTYYRSWQESERRRKEGRNTAGTTDAAELERLKATSEEEAKRKYENHEWDLTKLQQWKTANGR